jgi:formate-dependent nitrite reductase membrane component NrfD
MVDRLGVTCPTVEHMVQNGWLINEFNDAFKKKQPFHLSAVVVFAIVRLFGVCGLGLVLPAFLRLSSGQAGWQSTLVFAVVASCCLTLVNSLPCVHSLLLPMSLACWTGPPTK